MKVNNIIPIALSVLALQGCAGLKQEETTNTLSLKELSNNLNVYPDNRIGYTVSGSYPVRAWSNENIILALKLKNRLINTKDILWVKASEPDNKYWYKRITVQLKSGEKLVADFVDYPAYAAGGGGWVACMPDKTCTDPQRNVAGGVVSFPGFPNFLTGVNEGEIERLGEYLAVNGGANKTPKELFSNGFWVIPDLYTGSYTMKFSEYKDVSDVQSLLQSARQNKEEIMRRDEVWQNQRKTDDRNQQRSMHAYSTTLLRSRPGIGTNTNCGPIFEIRLPQVGVSTIQGPKFIVLSELFAPGVACYFVNGKYDSAKVRREYQIDW